MKLCPRCDVSHSRDAAVCVQCDGGARLPSPRDTSWECTGERYRPGKCQACGAGAWYVEVTVSVDVHWVTSDGGYFDLASHPMTVGWDDCEGAYPVCSRCGSSSPRPV